MAHPVIVAAALLLYAAWRLWLHLQRGDRRELPHRTVALLLRAALILLGLFGLFLLAAGAPASVAVLALALLPPICWSWVLAALGLERAAAAVALLARPLLWYEPTRRQVLFFAALGSTNDPTGRWARRLKAMLARVEDRSYRGVELACHAVLALHEGRAEEARPLLSLVAGMSPQLAPRHVRAYANHVLLADAALRGGWYEVAARAEMGPRTPTAALFAFAARRRLGTPPLERRLLGWGAWLLAPHRVCGFRLLEWARREHTRVASREAALAALARAPLSERLRAWARLDAAAPGSLSSEEITRLAASIDTLAEGASALTARHRLGALGLGTATQEVLGELEREVRERLSQHLTQTWMDGDRLEGAAGNAAFDARSRLLDELERHRDLLCERDVPSHGADDYALWLLWGKVRAAFDILWVFSADTRSVAFDTIVDQLTDLSAQLWNGYEQRAVAHDIFHFLYRHRTCTTVIDRVVWILKNRRVSLQLDAV